MSENAPKSVVDNIDNVAQLEEALTARPSAGERTGQVVAGFAGTITFVGCQLVIVVCWISINAGIVPGLRPFDPFPYSLGGTLLSMEGVLLASFVLMKQTHEARLSEQRSQLNLQANLLVEKEVTKIIQMLQRNSQIEGTDHIVTDEETDELGQETTVERLSEELDRRLDQGASQGNSGSVTA